MKLSSQLGSFQGKIFIKKKSDRTLYVITRYMFYYKTLEQSW